MTVNKVILLGVVSGEPEQKTLPKTNRVLTSFKMMTTEKGKDRDFNQYHSISVWNDKIGEVVKKYCKSGTQIYLEGKLSTRSYETDGQTKYVTEIQVGPFDGQLKLLGGGTRDSPVLANPVPAKHTPRYSQDDDDDDTITF